MEIKTNLNGLDSYNRLESKNTQAATKNAFLGEARQNAQTGKAASGDVVELSCTSLRSTVMQEAQGTSDFRQDKVNALRAAVSNGSYQVDSQAVAAGILKSDAGLLGR